MIKNVFFDFNGTIIDDVDLCLELLNKILNKQGKASVDVNTYKNVFTFPIKKYYENAGVDFSKDKFEDLAVDFINEYQPRSFKCNLYKEVIPTLEYLNNKNINCYILSASEIHNLMEQCENFKITKYFKEILGIDNIHASSKVNIAIDYIKKTNLSKDEILFIGDTLHDKEVADAIGVKCVLVDCGHQAKSILEKANVEIFDNVGALKEMF